jgi:hypothetical protein
MKNKLFCDDYSIVKPALSEYEDVIPSRSIHSIIHPYFEKINKKLQGKLNIAQNPSLFKKDWGL